MPQLPALPGPADWPALPPGSLPMQSRAWLQARLDLVPDPARQRLVAVGNGGRPRALAVLVEDGDWLREPFLMYEPSDLVWSDAEALDELAGELARQGRPLHLERLPAASPTLAALRRAYAGRGLVRSEGAMPTPYIDLPAGLTEADALFNAGRRSDFRRLERRAAAYGAVSYDIHAPRNGEELAPLLAAAFAIEGNSWKGEAGTALATDPFQGNFFVAFTRAAAAEGWLRLAFLRLDGRPVAMQIAGHWQDRFWLFKISHDRAFAACSPGQLLLRHTLGHALTAGLRSYEFLGLMAPWTGLWTRQLRHYVQVRALPPSLASVRAAARHGLGAALAPLRRFLS